MHSAQCTCSQLAVLAAGKRTLHTCGARCLVSPAVSLSC